MSERCGFHGELTSRDAVSPRTRARDTQLLHGVGSARVYFRVGFCQHRALTPERPNSCDVQPELSCKHR
eukprot:3432242-Lingulodinium_polyedra.AAC.1